MARRPNHLHPQPRLHRQSGHARLRVAGETYWPGRYGSPEAAAEYDRLIGEWLAGGKSRLPSKPSKSGAVLPAPLASPPAPEHSPASPTIVSVPSAQQPALLRAANIACDSGPGFRNSDPKEHVADPNGITVGELCSRYLRWIERNRCHNGRGGTSLYYGTR